jgi:hypothetical protein
MCAGITKIGASTVGLFLLVVAKLAAKRYAKEGMNGVFPTCCSFLAVAHKMGGIIGSWPASLHKFRPACRDRFPSYCDLAAQ